MPYPSAELLALASETRAQILERLEAGPMTVGEIAAGLPVSRPAISQHLRVLEGAKLVTEEYQGTRHIYRIAPPARAFDLFTAGMHQWWPRAHSLNPKVVRAAVIAEPQPGGRWFERGVDGSECDWGRVLAWEPPHRVLFAWQLDETWRFNPNFSTEVEVRFEAVGDNATQVSLEHRNLERYGVNAEKTRAGLDSAEGWMGGLQVFVSVAAAG
jgi:DNA-binding transcriptional ArsR family regulator